ncbi:MAG: hypothetical protein ACRDJJ_08490 [Actinomycetota bacterium]
MEQPIQRDGKWWHPSPDGTWMVWDETAREWRPAPAAPPPPPPPPGLPEASPRPSVYQTPSVGRSTSLPTRPLALLAAGIVVVATAAAFTVFRGPSEPAEAPALKSDAQQNGSVGSTQRLSQKRFVNRADAMCVAASRRVRALGRPTTPGELAAFLADTMKIGRRYLGRLEALGAPPKGAETWSDYMDMNRQAIGLVDRLKGDVEAKDVADLATRFTEIQALGGQAQRLERGYGLTRCARTSA